MKLEARIAALEERLSALESGGAVAVILADGEEWEDAAKRLAGSGGAIVVRRILSPEEWAQIAPRQQRELIEGLERLASPLQATC